MKYLTKALLLMSFAALSAGSVEANSVDCQRPASEVDRMVCGSQALLNMDTKYAQAYKAAKESADDPKQFMRLAQSDLSWRAENCRDAGCLEEWYENVTPRYNALASNARKYGGRKQREQPETVGQRVVQAVTVAATYESNKLRGDQEYVGKPIVISGVIGDIGRDVGGDPYVGLLGAYQFGAIKLIFATAQEPEMAKWRKWQTITVPCVGLGLTYDVPVFDCRRK